MRRLILLVLLLSLFQITFAKNQIQNQATVTDTIHPYLQSPTPSSIYICWHCAKTTGSVVEYGTTPELGNTVEGNYETIVDDDVLNVWHSVKLTSLSPSTTYFYKCISDSAESKIFKFRTQPPHGLNEGHLRFLVIGDNRTYPDDYLMVVEAMKEKMIELYGENYEEQVNLIVNVGDIVTNGWNLGEYIPEYFAPIYSMSHQLPSMVSIGNHENESDYFYQYMKYEELEGTEGEKYYSFQIGRAFFIAINSNPQLQNATQIAWLDSVLQIAENNDSIDWIFPFCHHPGRTETWIPGNTAYIQDQVIPLLAKFDKVKLFLFGHTHDYERGAPLDEGDYWFVNTSGGGGELARWREYTPKNYPEIQKSFDHYCYVLVDVDLPNRSYTCVAYSLGHKDAPLHNVVIDSFGYQGLATIPPTKPVAISNNQSIALPFTLQASEYSGLEPLNSSQFQVTSIPNDYSHVLIDSKRDYEDIYFDTGAPDWQPIDLNEGIDLNQFMITSELIPEPGTYFWRIRYRDQNLRWSPWSVEQTIKIDSTGHKLIKAHNRSLVFNGDDTYVEITDSLNLAVLPQKELTVEIWINLKSTDANGSFVGAVQDNGGYEKGWYLGNFNNTFCFGLSSVGTNDGDGVLSLIKTRSAQMGQWYHLAATYDGTTMNLYLDGRVNQSTTDQSGNILYDVGSYFDIGAYHDANEFYVMDGQIDELRLWNIALPDTLIQAWMHQELDDSHPYQKNLISYWNMNETVSGVRLHDATNNNNGLLYFMNLANVAQSSAPVGFKSAFVETADPTTIGPAGASLTAIITSKLHPRHYLGIYQAGQNDGEKVRYEILPENISYRFGIIWGIVEYGHGVIYPEDVIADLEIDYSQIQAASNPDSIRLLKRNNALSEWTDVTSQFSHNRENRKFSLTGRTDFREEYAIAWGKQASDSKVGTNDKQILEYQLSPNYPNPFNVESTIQYTLKNSCDVKLTVYNINGQEVAVLVDKNQKAGQHQIKWQASENSSGLYFFKIQAGSFFKVRKGVLLK